MLDINMLRKQLPEVVERLKFRHFEFPVAEFTELESERKQVQKKTEDLQALRNQISRKIGLAKKNGEDASEFMQQAASIPGELDALSKKLDEIRNRLQHLMLRVPNLPSAKVPQGRDDRDNIEQRRWGTPRQFDFPIKDHVDLGAPLGMDFETAARESGSRFVFLKGQIAHLNRAIGQFFLDTNTRLFGYTEYCTPCIVTAATMQGTGQLPKFEEDLYAAKMGGQNGQGDPLYLIPTAEVTLTNTVAGQILKESDLPIKMTALTQCYRSEAGSAGKDTRGMIRQHQFDKVEMVRIVKPEDSWAHLEDLTHCAEVLLQKLGLPYRVVLLCSGDIGFSSAQTYDLEVWLPAQNTYREISSCSNCVDFQARRMGARYKDKDGKVHFVHTLNGSGLAVGRTLVAILENYQNADGSVTVPEVLRPYMGGIDRLVPGKK